MNHRDHFFSVLEGKKPSKMPFVPDITDWYIGNKTAKGKERKYWAGKFIPDKDLIHNEAGNLPEKYRHFTLLDFYRTFDWGFHVHIYNWFDAEYADGVELVIKKDNDVKETCLHTPKGDLMRREKLAEDGTWCIKEHYIKNLKDLDIMSIVIQATQYSPCNQKINSILKQVEKQGQVDLVIPRSPFGKLVQEYMGFEKVVYALCDSKQYIEDFLKLQEEKDIELIKLACDAPVRLILISDHADENLISPRLYEEFCLPFYKTATDILHNSYKHVSTHLDGNIKGHFPLLPKTGFDLLDGCTPAPMFNYEVEELAEAYRRNEIKVPCIKTLVDKYLLALGLAQFCF